MITGKKVFMLFMSSLRKKANNFCVSPFSGDTWVPLERIVPHGILKGHKGQ